MTEQEQIQQGPGDDILNALEGGKGDRVILKQYKINADQLNIFKSLHYGLSNQKFGYNQINDLYPELKEYFKTTETPGQPAPKNSVSTPKTIQPQEPVQESEPEPNAFKLVQEKTRLGKELAASQNISKNAQSYMGASLLANDEAALNKRKTEISAIDEQLKKAGYDPEATTKALGDLPDIPGIDAKEAMQLKQDNPLQFDRYKGAIKSQYALLHAIGEKEGTKAANAFLANYQQLQKAPDYAGQRAATKDAVAAVYKFIDNSDEQKKVLKNLIVDKSFGYGVGLPGQEEAISADPRSQNLNPYQVTALQFLEDVDPATAQSYNRLLAFKPEEVEQLEKNSSFARGYQAKSRDLENMGMNLMRNSLEEKINGMLKTKPNWTEDDKNKYLQTYERYKLLSEDFKKQNDRYPAIAVMDADQQMQDAIGSSTKGVAEKTVLGIGENVDDALNWIGGLIQSPFRTNKESALDDLQLLGDKRLSQLSQYETKGQDLFNKEFKTVFVGDLKKEIDNIKANSVLSDDEQRDAITKAIIKDNRENVKFVPNDQAGKMNFTAKAVLNTISNVASEIAPQIALAYISGGGANASKVQELTSLFGSVFATAYNDIYNDAIEKNLPNPSQYALVHTTIEAATELLSNDVAKAKKLFGGKVAGSILEDVTQEEVNLLSKTGRFARLKETLKATGKMGLRNAAQETYEEVTGQLAGNVVDKKMFNQEVNLTDDVLKTGVTTFVGMLPLAGLGLPFKYNEISKMQKYALYEAAMNPDKYLLQIDEDLKSNKITSSEAEARKATINNAGKVARTMNSVRADGEVMTDNEKTELLTNEVVADSVNEQKKNAPAETKEKLEQIEEKLDKEKEELLKPQKNETATEAEAETETGTSGITDQTTSDQAGAEQSTVGTGETAATAPDPLNEGLPDDVYVDLYNSYREALDEDQTPLSLVDFKRKVDADTILEQPPSGSAKKVVFKDKHGKEYSAYLDNHGQNSFSVKVYDGKEKIGRLFLSKDKATGNYYATGVDVQAKYRRKGVATKMYDLAEKEFGVHIKPSKVQSKDGKGFWANRSGPQPQVTQEIKTENDVQAVLKETYRQKAGDIAQKLRSAKRGGKEAFGGLLGVSVAVYDGMLETAATVIEAGGSIADALKAAVAHIQQHDPTIPEGEIRDAVHKNFIASGVIASDDQLQAVEKIIKKTPATVTNDKLAQQIQAATGMPIQEVVDMIDAIRNPRIPAAPVIATANLSPESKQVSINKIKKVFNKPVVKKPSWFRRVLGSLRNGSAWIENPYRFITKITEDINKEYKLENKEQIPLGRQFEKVASGRAALKVQSFVNEIINGNIGKKKLGRLKGERYEEFQNYLFNRRVIDRLDKQTEKLQAGEEVNRQTGNVTKQDAEVDLERIKNKYGNLDDFDARAKAFQAHMDTMLQNLVAAGILSQDAYDQIKADNDFYAPFSVVHEKLLANQKKQPVGISGVIKRIKGIDYKLIKTTGDALSIINALGGALEKDIISPEEYFNTSLQILDDAKNQGLITQAEYDQHIAGLENPGFAVNDILDAAANMIYKAEGMALKNRMLQRLYAYKAFDTKGLFIQDVDGFQPTTLKGGETRMVPKPLNTIKVEPGMAAIKVRVEGKDKIVAVNQKAAEKLTTISNYEMSNWLHAADLANRLFRAFVITLSPGFQVVNFAIDFVRTAMLSRYGPLAGKGLVQPVVNAVFFMPQYIEALLHSAFGNVGLKSKAYKQWMESDSFSKGMFDNLFNNEKKIKQVSAPLAKRVLMNFLKLKFIDVPGSILEQTHKLATYQRGLSVEGFKPEMFTAMLASLVNRNINSNMTQEELDAAMDRLNYEVQNFAGSPNFPETHRWMKIASIFLQFFSARVKGEITDYRRVANMFTTKGEGVKLSGQDRTQLILQFLGAAGAIAGYAIMNNLKDEDEDEFNKIPSYHQNNYLNIPFGQFEYKTTNEDGYETTISLRDYAKVPLRGLTATLNVVANSFVKYYKRSNPEEFKKMGMAFMGNASPINLNGRDERELGESAVSNLTPIFKFFLEYSFNRDTHSHRDIIPDTHGNRSMLANYRNGNIAPWEVATDKTPDWAVKMSKFLFDELGMHVNAITLDHMENTMGNPTELYDKAIKKRLWRSEMKYPIYMSKTPPEKEPPEEKPAKE